MSRVAVQKVSILDDLRCWLLTWYAIYWRYLIVVYGNCVSPSPRGCCIRSKDYWYWWDISGVHILMGGGWCMRRGVVPKADSVWLFQIIICRQRERQQTSASRYVPYVTTACECIVFKKKGQLLNVWDRMSSLKSNFQFNSGLVSSCPSFTLKGCVLLYK